MGRGRLCSWHVALSPLDRGQCCSQSTWCQRAWCGVHHLEHKINLKKNLLEKITPAVEFTVPGVALLAEDTLTLAALYTLHVPRLVQDFHQIALHNRLLATATYEWSHHLAQSQCLMSVSKA